MTLGTSTTTGINPYAPPRSRVDDIPVPTTEPAFFSISITKLVLMSLATFGLYEVYWFYKQWKCAERLENEKLNAIIRAFFYPATSYWLFRRILAHAGVVGVGGSLQAGLLAITLLILSVLYRLPDPYWLVCLLTFLPLLPVQSMVNRINQKVAPEADANGRFGGWNIAAMVGGVLFWALLILGMLLEEQAS